MRKLKTIRWILCAVLAVSVAAVFAFGCKENNQSSQEVSVDDVKLLLDQTEAELEDPHDLVRPAATDVHDRKHQQERQAPSKTSSPFHPHHPPCFYKVQHILQFCTKSDKVLNFVW